MACSSDSGKCGCSAAVAPVVATGRVELARPSSLLSSHVSVPTSTPLRSGSIGSRYALPTLASTHPHSYHYPGNRYGQTRCKGPCSGTGSYSITLMDHGRDYHEHPLSPDMIAFVEGRACLAASADASTQCIPRGGPHSRCLCHGECTIRPYTPTFEHRSGSFCIIGAEARFRGICTRADGTSSVCSGEAEVAIVVAGECPPEIDVLVSRLACERAKARATHSDCIGGCRFGECTPGPVVITHHLTTQPMVTWTLSVTADFTGECQRV